MCAFAALSGAAKAAPPLHFSDYPITEHYTGPTTKPILAKKQDKEFRTKLQAAARQGPNFAGHYIVTTFGCGSSCVMGAIINAKNGMVTWIPFTVCCGDDADPAPPIDFRPDSALMIIKGMRNERDNGTFYYLLRKGRLHLLAEQHG